MATSPLEGLKVLDLSRVLAGPLCTMMLGDLGATVIKVERPETGDDTRGWGPPFDAHGDSAYFLSANRNKASLTADFASADDQALLHRLLSEADLVVENFLPGTLERFGLDAASMLSRFPQLLWCTISGFGAHSRRPGYDFVAQAESGWMAITGAPDGEPMKHGVALVDVITGKDAAIGLLALLVRRERQQRRGEAPLPPEDRWVQVTLASSAQAALVNVAQNALVSGRDAARWGNAHANLVPYQLFHAADRPLVLAVGADAQWPAAARALELEGLASDPALRTNAGRLAHRGVVVAAIAAQVGTRPAGYWLARLEAAGVPCGVVRTVQESLADVSASARSGMPPLWNGRVRLEPPALGEHSVSVRAKHWSFLDDLPIPLSVDV